MQISKTTIDVLKNFATINQGLVFSEGSVLRTISGMKNIYASAAVPDLFPKSFGVYDLNELLGTLSLFSNPEIDFKDEYFEISEDSSTVNYFYCNPSVVISPPSEPITLKDPSVSFLLPKEILDQLIKAANVMKLKDFVIKNGELVVLNKAAGGNKFKIKTDMKFDPKKKEFATKVDNLKMVPNDYDVIVTDKAVEFKSTDGTLQYIVALDI